MLGGDCIVAFQQTGERLPGEIQFSTVHNGRLFLFHSQEHLDTFLAEPDTFVDVDLALGGTCPVCITLMKMKMPGKEEFLLIHNGLRYHFAAAKHRETFRANPNKFIEKKQTDSEPGKGSSDY